MICWRQILILIRKDLCLKIFNFELSYMLFSLWQQWLRIGKEQAT